MAEEPRETDLNAAVIQLADARAEREAALRYRLQSGLIERLALHKQRMGGLLAIAREPLFTGLELVGACSLQEARRVDHSLCLAILMDDDRHLGPRLEERAEAYRQAFQRSVGRRR